MVGFAAVFILLACGAAYAADVVGLVNSQKIMFQHPRFDEASKILIFFTRPLEGNLALILEREKDPERRQMIMDFSTHVSEFSAMDRAISEEKDPEKKEMLWEDRQNKLKEFEAGLMSPIFRECRKAIQTVMADKKMTVLLEVDAAYYGGTDITEDVILLLKRP